MTDAVDRPECRLETRLRAGVAIDLPRRIEERVVAARAVVLISARNRSAPTTTAKSGFNTFRATFRSCFRSSARYTVAIPPSPSSDSRWYRPSRAPFRRVIGSAVVMSRAAARRDAARVTASFRGTLWRQRPSSRFGTLTCGTCSRFGLTSDQLRHTFWALGNPRNNRLSLDPNTPNAQAACSRTNADGSPSAAVSTGTASAEPQFPSATHTLRSRPSRYARFIGDPRNATRNPASSTAKSRSASSINDGPSSPSRALYAGSAVTSAKRSFHGHASWQISHP